MRGCFCLVVIKSPPDWEVGVYAAGALALLGITAVSLWKLWTSGSFPSPSPFPNYNYRYLQQKYGETYAEARQKVRLLLLGFFVFCCICGGGGGVPPSKSIVP